MLALNLLAALLLAAGFFLLFIAAPGGRTDWDRTISLRGRVLGTVLGVVLMLVGLALARA